MYSINGVYFCSIEECVTGIHWLSEPMPIMSNGKCYVLYGHRHDQTILRISRIKHDLPTAEKKHGSFMNLEALLMQNKTTVHFIIIMEVKKIYSYDSRSKKVRYFLPFFVSFYGCAHEHIQ